MKGLKQRQKDMAALVMRDGIYEAAVEVLTECGADGLTMQRIAEKAGIAKGSLFNYFRDKRELLQFIHERLTEPAKEFVQETMARSISAPEKLEAILRFWFEYFATNHGVCQLLFNDPQTKAALADQEKTVRAEGTKDLAAIFEQGVAEGSFRAVDAHRAAQMFLGAVIFLFEQRTADQDEWSVDEMVEAITDLFLQGLKPRD